MNDWQLSISQFEAGNDLYVSYSKRSASRVNRRHCWAAGTVLKAGVCGSWSDDACFAWSPNEPEAIVASLIPPISPLINKGVRMPYARMDLALSKATIEKSDPQQFLLSWPDFKVFVAGTSLNKTSQGSSPDWFYLCTNVIRATEETTNSVLHVIGSRLKYTNPIVV